MNDDRKNGFLDRRTVRIDKIFPENVEFLEFWRTKRLIWVRQIVLSSCRLRTLLKFAHWFVRCPARYLALLATERPNIAASSKRPWLRFG